MTGRLISQQVNARQLINWLKSSVPSKSQQHICGAKPRAEFGPSVWFSLSEGRNQNASPRHLLPMVCKAGNLSKDDIGAIRIVDDLSYVEIREASVSGFLAALGPSMKIEGSKDVVRLDKAPNLPAFERSKSNRNNKGKSQHRKGDTTPVDWNDEPAPRRRKPKPEDRKSQKPSDKRSHGDKKDRAGGKGKSHEPRNNSGKGTPPPKGKPSSKKNRARAEKAAAAKGGNSKPKRRSY